METSRITAKEAITETCAALYAQHKDAVEKAFHKIREHAAAGRTEARFEGAEAAAVSCASFYFKVLGFKIERYYTSMHLLILTISWHDIGAELP